MTTSEDKPPYVWPGPGPKEIIYEVWGSSGILYETFSEKGAMDVIKYWNNTSKYTRSELKGFGNRLMLGSRAK